MSPSLTSTMTIDKFGRSGDGVNKTIKHIIKGNLGNGFKLTSTSDYDIENKRLSNLKTPYDDKDAATKKYVDMQISNLYKEYDILKGEINQKLNSNLTTMKDNLHNKMKIFIKHLNAIQDELRRIEQFMFIHLQPTTAKNIPQVNKNPDTNKTITKINKTTI